jgi:branched-chain amino acid transport system substrate-binding protein
MMKWKLKFICILASGIALLLLMGTPSNSAAQSKAPIKVGLLTRHTGNFALLGKSQTNSLKLFFEQNNYEVAGRKIELVIEDTEGKADLALLKLKKLVELDKVDVVVAFLSTYEGYAIRDYINENKIPTVSTSSGAALSRDRYSPYQFRVVPSTYQYTYEPSKWWYNRGYKKVIFVGGDYAPAREAYDGFKKGFEEVGGKIVQEVWPAVNTTDFGPYFPGMKVDQADALIAAMWGNMPTRFVNQFASYGMKGKIPIIGVAAFADETVTLPGMGANAEGLLDWYTSCATTDLPENKKFVAAYQKLTGTMPGFFSYFAYVATQTVYEGLKKTGGDVDKEKLRTALANVEFTTPMGGKAYFDDKNAMAFDMIFLEARKADSGEIHLYEIGRLKNVKDPYQVFP